MKKALFTFLVVATIQSCIPLRIAPKIVDYKITKGKKFKRGLPKRQMFVFEDPKEASAFYNYVNTKFRLEHQNVYDDIPFVINGTQYFFAFYEIEISGKVLNLIPIVLDVALLNADMDPMFEKAHSSKRENWYIAIEVYSDMENDCLSKESLSIGLVLNYLRVLKKEYLFTHNYNEILFK
ncbi:MAG: hypothetical protein V3U92_04840 [Cellulophaga sp.]